MDSSTHKLVLTMNYKNQIDGKSASTLPELIEKRTSTSIPINKKVITKIDQKCENKANHF